MADMICLSCGSIITKPKRKKFCCNECSELYYKKNYYKEYYQKHKKNKIIKGYSCRFCGKEVVPKKIGKRISKRTYHEKCLIEAAYKEIQNGGIFYNENKILRFAMNKGFTKSEILEYMEEMQNERGFVQR